MRYTLAQGKIPFASTTVLRERAMAQVKLAQAEAMLRAARALLYDTLSEMWEQTLAGEPPSLVQRADLLLAVAHATSSAATVVELAYSVAGTSGIYTRNPLERHFCDVQVLKQHGFASEKWCRATEHIAEQIETIHCIEAKGFTYCAADGLYFDTSKCHDYGRLARLDSAGLQAGMCSV